MLGTAEEDSDATDRARQAAGRAGSLKVMPSSQGSRVLPARMRFSIRRRYVAGRSVPEHVTVHRRPPRRPIAQAIAIMMQQQDYGLRLGC
jgi:hypothetical protein